MIIFGTSKERTKYSEDLYPSTCPYCRQQNSMTANVYMRYAHVWYIPIFPVGKRLVATCSHCKAGYELKDLTGAEAEKSREVLAKAKYPLSYWSILLLIGLAIAFVIILGLFSKTNH